MWGEGSEELAPGAWALTSWLPGVRCQAHAFLGWPGAGTGPAKAEKKGPKKLLAWSWAGPACSSWTWHLRQPQLGEERKVAQCPGEMEPCPPSLLPTHFTIRCSRSCPCLGSHCPSSTGPCRDGHAKETHPMETSSTADLSCPSTGWLICHWASRAFTGVFTAHVP